MGRTAVRRLLRPARGAVLLGLVASLILAGCGSNAPGTGGGAGRPAGSHSDHHPGHTGAASPDPHGRTSEAPSALHQSLQNPDILIYSARTLPASVVRRIAHVKGVAATERYSMAQFYFHENEVRYGAVDPTTFRRWTLAPTAEATDVWRRVANGEIAIDPKLGKRIQDKSDYVRMGSSAKAPNVHVGAYAQLFDPRFNDLGLDAVVGQKMAGRLGMVPDNALLVSTGTASPLDRRLQKRLRAIAGKRASVQILGFQFDPKAVQTAVLTGESATSAVGTFNFTANSNGSVNIQGPWVQQNISTEQVPILGRVTCNRVMLPQLIAALTEIQQRGLAKDINPSQYGGCYVPRYIAGTHTLSYHAFGLAVDLNVPENQRGTRGQMNPQIVSIFAKWGFQWGGDWHYTDPMHFELHRIVRASGS